MKLHEVIHRDGFYWYTPTVLREPVIVRIVNGEVWEIGSEHPTIHLPGEFAGPIHHYTTVTMGEHAQPTSVEAHERRIVDMVRNNREEIRVRLGQSLPNELTEEMLIAAQKADGDHGDAQFWREYGTGWRLRRMWSALVGTARGYHEGGIVPQKRDDDRDTMTFAECVDTMTFAECVDVLRGFRAKNTRLRNAIECLIPYLEKMGKTTLTWNDYQARVRLWMLHVFGGRVMRNVEERCDRFLEEVIELLQSLDYDPRRIPRLVSYVYNRPVGKKFQEAGGVAVTFSALCDAAEIDMADAGEVELQRVWDQRVIDKVRSKQQSKRDLHSPLPGREHAP